MSYGNPQIGYSAGSSVQPTPTALQPAAIHLATVARMYLNNASFLTVAGGSGQAGPLDTIQLDPGNNCIILSGIATYVVPITGYYQINGAIYFKTTAASGNYAAQLFKNAVLLSQGAYAPGAVGNNTCTLNDIQPFTVGDQVQLGYYSSTALNPLNGIAYTYMSVARVA